MSVFDKPLPFWEALEKSRERGLLPTELTSAEIGRMRQDVIDRSVLSARCNSARHLQAIKDTVDDLLNGKINKATARARIRDSAEALGYDPARGFRGEKAVEPAMPGSLQDHSSDTRINLILETQVSQMRGFGQWKQGQTSAALFQFPALELIRLFPREVPRGLKRTKGGALVEDPGNDWIARWEKAGGQFFNGRMIARKDDPVWERLGSRELFADGLGTPYAPFAFNSGFRTRPVSRETCIALGVIAEGDRIEGTAAEMNEGLQVAAKFDPELLRRIQAGLKVRIAEGIARLEKVNPAEAALLRNRGRVLLALLNNGTHEGALKGWETRHIGRAATAVRKKLVRMARADVKRCLRQKQDVTAAMHIAGVGDVDFPYGRPGTWTKNEQGASHADGYGLSHIVAKHGTRAALEMPEVLATGTVEPHPQDAGKRIIRAARGTAIVEKAAKGRHYVLTSYDPNARALVKTDRRERQLENREGRLPERFWQYGQPACEKDGNGLASACPTRAEVMNGHQGAGAFKDSILTPQSPEVKP